MKHLRFCMMFAHYSKDASNKGDIKRLGAMHPQKALKELGITYQHSTPQSMGDQWWFWNCENVPDDMPGFLTELKSDPMECIGYGLRTEIAEKIRDYNKPASAIN